MKKSLQEQAREALANPYPKRKELRPLVRDTEWYGVMEAGRLTAVFNRLSDAELWATTDFEGLGVRSAVDIVDLRITDLSGIGVPRSQEVKP